MIFISTGRGITGGVAFYIRTALAPLVSLAKINERCGYIWLHVPNIVAQESLYLCGVYLPHKQSSFWKSSSIAVTDVLDDIAADVCKYQGKSATIVLMGDLNARTGIELDCVHDIYSHVSDCLGLGLPCVNTDFCKDLPVRSSLDAGHKSVIASTHGQDILQFCKTTGLVIFNGRMAGDVPGQCTLYQKSGSGSSVIDYFIGTPRLLSQGGKLHVMPLMPDTDHCSVRCYIPCTFAWNVMPGSVSSARPAHAMPAVSALIPRFRYKAGLAQQYQQQLASAMSEVSFDDTTRV